MRKILTVLLVLVVAAVMTLSGCGEKESEESPVTYEIAMVTDTASIEDGAFNEAVWDGIEDFVDENPVSYKAYLTTEDTTDAYLRTVKEAIDGGAKLVIASGSTFSNTIYQAQSEYPEVSFVLIDGCPQDADGTDGEIRKNTAAVTFAEEQAGYLAGYAAVCDGYKKLGFIGGKELLPVQRFGWGFIQGADEAARERSISGIEVRFGYAGTFDADSQTEKLAEDCYAKGTEVIFACAGGSNRSIMKAAEKNKGKVIGVDVDQSDESDTVLVSAVKNLDVAVSDILWEYYGDDAFAGGQQIQLTAENGGVGLSMDASRMKHFSKTDYEEIFKKLADKTLTPQSEGIKSPTDLASGRVKVDLIK